MLVTMYKGKRRSNGAPYPIRTGSASQRVEGPSGSKSEKGVSNSSVNSVVYAVLLKPYPSLRCPSCTLVFPYFPPMMFRDCAAAARNIRGTSPD